MLPILGGNNRSPAWTARLQAGRAAWQEQCRDRARAQLLAARLAERFIAAEQKLTTMPPSTEGLSQVLTILQRQAQAPAGNLDLNFFHALQEALQTSLGLRTGPGEPQVPEHKPAQPAALPQLLPITFDWFQTESFRELHPVEQATLVHLRLVELQPFPAQTTRLARFAADLYLLRADLPPLIITGEPQVYKRALHQGLLMNTQPLLELCAEALDHTLVELLNS